MLGEEPDQGRNLLQGIPLDQQVHNVDPFQLPLVGAGAFGVPPVLPMGGVAGPMQGKHRTPVNVEDRLWKNDNFVCRCRRNAGY